MALIKKTKLENVLESLERQICTLASKRFDKYEFFNDVLTTLINLITTAKKGTVFEYRENKKVCIAQYGYDNSFIENLYFQPEYDLFFLKSIPKSGKILSEEIIINLKHLEKAPMEIKELIQKYAYTSMRTLKGVVNFKDEHIYEIYLDTPKKNKYSNYEKKIFSLYLDIVNLYLFQTTILNQVERTAKTLESFFDSSPSAIVEIDSSLNIIRRNKRFIENFRNEKNLDHILTSEALEKIKRGIEDHKIFSKESRLKEKLVYEITFIPLPEEDRYFVVMSDITQKYLSQEFFTTTLERFAETVAVLAEHYNVDITDHIRRMKNYTTTFAKLIGISDDQYLLGLKLGMMLHDVGKFKIDPQLLNKPYALTREEKEYVQKHVEFGIEILKNFEDLLKNNGKSIIDTIYNIVLYHHECYDGSGYLKGLKGEEIPLEGRIAKILDVYDALTHNRVYRRALSVDEAIKIMDSEIEKFDRNLYNIFKQNIHLFPP
ncbi:MAG: HD domain-containing phosphohydrolase [Candidatus Woesearchaeota archaeon]